MTLQEIEQAKMCSTQIMVFSHHPWFLESAEEEDILEEDESGIMRETIIPKHIRTRWLHVLRHTKVTFLFSGSSDRNASVLSFPKSKRSVASTSENTTIRNSERELLTDPLKPSEIISQALETGELSPEDVHMGVSGSTEAEVVDGEEMTENDENIAHENEVNYPQYKCAI